MSSSIDKSAFNGSIQQDATRLNMLYDSILIEYDHLKSLNSTKTSFNKASKAFTTIQTGNKSQINSMLCLGDQLQKLFLLIGTNKCSFVGNNHTQSFRGNSFNETFSKTDDSRFNFVVKNNDVNLNCLIYFLF